MVHSTSITTDSMLAQHSSALEKVGGDLPLISCTDFDALAGILKPTVGKRTADSRPIHLKLSFLQALVLARHTTLFLFVC